MPVDPMTGMDPQESANRAAMIRRLSLALMSQPQTPGLGSQQGGLMGGMAQGLQTGQNWRLQGDLNKAMGVQSPFDQLLKSIFDIEKGGGMAAPGSMGYGGPR